MSHLDGGDSNEGGHRSAARIARLGGRSSAASHPRTGAAPWSRAEADLWATQALSLVHVYGPRVRRPFLADGVARDSNPHAPKSGGLQAVGLR